MCEESVTGSFSLMSAVGPSVSRSFEACLRSALLMRMQSFLPKFRFDFASAASRAASSASNLAFSSASFRKRSSSIRLASSSSCSRAASASAAFFCALVSFFPPLPPFFPGDLSLPMLRFHTDRKSVLGRQRFGLPSHSCHQSALFSGGHIFEVGQEDFRKQLL